MRKLIAAGVIGIIVAFIVLMCFTSVPAGYTGVPVTFGKVADYTFDSGFHFKSPFTNVVKMDNRIQKHTINMAAFSKDIQDCCRFLEVLQGRRNTCGSSRSLPQGYPHLPSSLRPRYE